nr:unnamed protein product [Digitaria exilis]
MLNQEKKLKVDDRRRRGGVAMTKTARSASVLSEAAAENAARRVTPMKLLVRVVEARGLPAVHLNGSSDPFVKLKLGKRRAKTAVVKRSLAPAWEEEFSFLVGDVAEELVVSVLNEDKYFSNDLLGLVRVPLAQVMETDELSLGTQWYQLQPKNKKSKKKCRGEVCLYISLSTRSHVSDESQCVLHPASDDLASSSDSPTEHKAATLSTASSYIDLSAISSIDRASYSSFERLPYSIPELPARSSTEQVTSEPGPVADNDAIANPSSVVEVLSRYFFRKPVDTPVHSITSDNEPVDQLQEPKVSSSEDCENPEKATTSESSLDELLKIMESKDQGSEMPANLPVSLGLNILILFSVLGSDHGVKAHGDGWLLTVALIEGTGIIAAGSSDLFDLYVVFTCNAKKKTSSIKFQTSDPKWNEVFEFDAMDDPPSRMDIAIYDSSGQCIIGHAEVNFLKNNLSDLTDIWLPLDGKCDQASHPKLHLRIFLNNSRGTEVVINYLSKMGKEVGKKINLRSAQTNAAFRKLFALPPEEFLIDDFTCHLKRKMPLQDRGLEAKHGAKGTDHNGRLKFHFQSFVSFNDAYRIITAIWKMRALGPEPKGELVEKDEPKELQPEEGGSLFTHADVKMSEILSSVLSVDVESLMEMFAGGPLEHKVMQKLQLKYHMTDVPSKPNTCSVQVSLGIAWLKSTKQQKKVTKNIISNSSNRLKELFAEVEKELTSRNGSLLNAATGSSTA